MIMCMRMGCNAQQLELSVLQCEEEMTHRPQASMHVTLSSSMASVLYAVKTFAMQQANCLWGPNPPVWDPPVQQSSSHSIENDIT